MTFIGNILHTVADRLKTVSKTVEHQLNRDVLEPQDTEGLERSTEGLPQHQGIFDTCEAWLEPRPEKFTGRIDDKDRLRYLNVRLTNGLNVLWDAKRDKVAVTQQAADGPRSVINRFGGNVELGKYADIIHDRLELNHNSLDGIQHQYIKPDTKTELWLQPHAHLSLFGCWSPSSHAFHFNPGNPVTTNERHIYDGGDSYDAGSFSYNEEKDGSIRVRDKDGEETLTPLIPLSLYMNRND